ncbi:MAG: amidase, partial [Gemella haemolysans]|nr:amidase [Gemella haemolysans]
MKKNNIKYVLIPAFAAAALFPVLANDNQAKANEDKAATTSTVNKPETTSEKPASIPTTNNIAETTATTPASLANSIKPTTVNNNETTNSASVINNETVKPKAQFTVAEYKQKSALELAQLIREKKVTSTELVDLAYKVIAEENPKLNAVLTTENGKIPKAIVDEAYRTAKEIDNRISAGKLAANPVDWKAQPFLG